MSLLQAGVPDDPRSWRSSDGATLAVAGRASAVRLAAVRTPEAADAEISTAPWNTPCELLAAGVETGGPADAILVTAGGDGLYPYAVGYDAGGAASEPTPQPTVSRTATTSPSSIASTRRTASFTGRT